MNDILKNSYKQYRSKNFIMLKQKGLTKQATGSGAYIDRENTPFKSNIKGYVAIVPPEIIVVDADLYESNCEFDKLIKALDLGYEPEPSIATPSGGLHYFFENKYPDLVIGSHGFKSVDIKAGYQNVFPIVGTTVKNKQDKLRTYEWHEDNYAEELIINPFSESMVEVLQLHPRATPKQQDDDDDLDDLINASIADDMPLSEVEELCEQIPIENYGYDDGYLKFGMALYDRFSGSDEGLKIFQSVCLRSDLNDAEYNEKKWNSGAFKSNGSITHKTLRSLSHEGVVYSVTKAIKEATTEDELTEATKKLTTQRLNTTSKTDPIVRNDFLELLCKKSLEISDRPDRVKWKKAVKFKEAEIEQQLPDDFSIYRLNNKYLIRTRNKTMIDVSSTQLKETLYSFDVKFTPEALSKYKCTSIPTISAYREIPDYTIKQASVFGLEEQDGTKIDAFIVRFNPLHKMAEIELDDEIINDFFNKVWGGKLEHIVKLIALTVKLKETKLNRLMLVAPSNAGKSEIFTMMNFQKINMKRLVSAMGGDKGVGSSVINGIVASGLLLIDETNTSLPAEIKDMDKEIHIDQFGNGGTQILPLHFTALTSTHKTATRNNSDELYNRFLQVELTKSDMTYTITESPLFRANSDKYTTHIRAGLNQLFKEILLNDEGMDELRELQEQYRLPLNDDLDEALLGISEEFIEFVKSTGIHKLNGYYMPRKGDITGFFEDKLTEIGGLDVGKFTEKLFNHFSTGERVGVKFDGKPVKAYKINLEPFTKDEDTLVNSLFDDLDLEEF